MKAYLRPYPVQRQQRRAFMLMKAVQHKYLSKHKKNGRWVYVYPKKGSGNRHSDTHQADRTRHVPGDDQIHAGSSFSAGSGKGHYQVESVTDGKVSFHLDDEGGKRGETQTMSLKDFKATVAGAHKDAHDRHATEGLKARQDILKRAELFGTEKQKARAKAEVERWKAKHLAGDGVDGDKSQALKQKHSKPKPKPKKSVKTKAKSPGRSLPSKEDIARKHDLDLETPKGRRQASGELAYLKASAALGDEGAPSSPLSIDSSVKSPLTGDKLSKRLETFQSKDENRLSLRGSKTIDGVTYASDGARLVGVRTGLEDGALQASHGDLRVIQEDFPDVRVAIPEEDPSKQVTFSVSSLRQLASAVKGLDQIHGKNSSAILFQAEGGSTSASINGPASHGSGDHPSVAGVPHAEKIRKTKAQFNASFVKDAIAGLKAGDSVRVQLPKSGTAPLRIDRADGEVHIIMPMRL